MKVYRPEGKTAVVTYRPARPQASAPEPSSSQVKPQQADAPTFSRKAREAAALRNVLRSTPEVRTDLVERIKAQVEAGQYHVEPSAVAARILRSGVLDE